LLDKIDGLVFTLGDNSQDEGTEKQYQECYGPTWGRHKERTRPVPGNHDYGTAQGAPYFAYFGAFIGKGYYSYTVGTWHIIAMNSMIPAGAGSEQAQWLQADLAANPAVCTLAYWHHPVFSSGAAGVSARMKYAFKLLYNAGADVILNGDTHHYERFAPMGPSARIEPDRGIRQFVVGTGGASLNPFGPRWPATEVRDNTTWGVLKLTLHSGSYSWDFIPVEGGAFTDSGSAPCVNPK
jgi:3',5'-cyclic AMP phosphodiesterase CpdA